ncbi:hypothetical protein RI367_001571 [Sorochytrium milnesiophthora]
MTAAAHDLAPFLAEHVFSRTKHATYGVTRCPMLAGQISAVLTGVDNLFASDAATFVETMLDLKKHAEAIRAATQVRRCALATSGDNTIHLFPLHGVSAEWKPVLHPELVFDERYPGYVTSKSGPRATREALAAVQQRILAHSNPPKQPDYTFVGAQTDNNLFARIVRGEEEQWRVWESETHVAFLTPFPNMEAFTVLVPRRHLSSDILGLDEGDYASLMHATHATAQALKRALSCEQVAMIFEGFEIDYAHVKLIPHLSSSATGMQHESVYHETYQGYVTTQPGPAITSVTKLDALAQKMRDM